MEGYWDKDSVCIKHELVPPPAVEHPASYSLILDQVVRG